MTVTVATLQRAWSIGVPLAAAALASWWQSPPRDPSIVLAAAIAAPIVIFGTLLALEFAIAAIADPRTPRNSLRRALRIWVAELSASLRIFLWRQPWRCGFAEPARVRDPQRPALLLIHGLLCNRACWRPLLDSGLLREFNVATVNLEPIFADIDAYAEVVHHAVEKLRAETGSARVVLVGHSMGGLAARVYLRKHGDQHVARVITLASPHQGTVLGKVAYGRNVRQMARHSRFIDRLAATDAGRYAKFTCIATGDDNLVVPRSSALLAGARQHALDGVGHLALLEDERAWRIVVDEARAAAR